MRLSRCRSVTEVGEWMKAHGVTPSENRAFGYVSPVHQSDSLHYQLGARGRQADDGQGNLALDVNDNAIKDSFFYRLVRRQWNLWKPQSETESLNWVYSRIIAVAEKKKWPLWEMFFAARGFKATYGYAANRPISGHDTHLHAGWSKHNW